MRLLRTGGLRRAAGLAGAEHGEGEEGLVGIVQPRDQAAARARQGRGPADLAASSAGPSQRDVVDQGPIGRPARRQREHDADLDQREHAVAHGRRLAEQHPVAEEGDEQGEQPGQHQRQGRSRRGQRLIAAGADRLRLAVDIIEHAARRSRVGGRRLAGRDHATSSRRGIQSAGSSPLLGADLVEQPHGALAPGQDGEQVALAGEVEPRDDALGAMLDQEAVRVVGQRADQLDIRAAVRPKPSM